MDRISGANYVTVGGLRMWQDRNQVAGITGTFGNALWFNGVQETILSAVTAAGLTPTDADNTQLEQAINILAENVVYAEFAGSVRYSGWQKFSTGNMLQWGSGNTVTGQEDYVAFPVVFPNNVFAIIAQESNAQGWGNPPVPDIFGTTRAPGSQALTGFLISCTIINRSGVPSYQGSTGFNFFAVGN